MNVLSVTPLDRNSTGSMSSPSTTVNKIRQLTTSSVNSLNCVLEEAGIGIWSVSVNDDTVGLCPTATAFFSNTDAQMTSIFSILRRIFLPDARQLMTALNRACSIKGSLSVDVRLITLPEDCPKWLRISGSYSPEKQDEVLMGLITDISAEKIEEQRKEDYVALLNHELKSPLTTMKLYIQMAIKQARAAHNVQVPEILEKAELQIGIMSRMIDNFLITSAVSNAHLQLIPEPFQMIRLIHETVTEVGLVYPDRKFDFSFSSEELVFADREKIAQVMANYLSNAVKYSVSGAISIKCISNAGWLQVSVADKGNGIAPEDQSKIFGRFYRTNPRGIKGFGLGLYLVKEIIDAHRGKVWLESVPGFGSTFHFSLPVI